MVKAECYPNASRRGLTSDTFFQKRAVCNFAFLWRIALSLKTKMDKPLLNFTWSNFQSLSIKSYKEQRILTKWPLVRTTQSSKTATV